MLDSFLFRNALVDITENDVRSVAIGILGYEVVGIIAPAVITGTPTIDGFLLDPGDGTLRQVIDSAGTAVTMSGVIAVNELQIIPPTHNLHLIGSSFAFDLSAAQGADRTFLVLLKKI